MRLHSAWFASGLARIESRRRIDLGFAGAMVLMLLASPLGWMYYFLILLPGLVVIFRLSAGLPSAMPLRALALFAWLIPGLPHFLIKAHQIADPLEVLLQPTLYTLSLLVFAGILIFLARRTEG